MADEPVSRILCAAALANGAATIIPLAPASRPGSSDLPEGSSSRAYHRSGAARKGACSFEFAQRAGPALPSYLVLHHAGFALPPPLLPERWALTPPFHPYLRRDPLEDIPKVFLRAITGIRHAGGIFSVALSVNSSTSCCRSPGVTRRVALYPGPAIAGRRVALRSCSAGLSPGISIRKVVSGLSSRLAACATKPAIIQLTRHLHCIPQILIALACLRQVGFRVSAFCPGHRSVF
jgi:hypothetical protein